MAIALRWKKTSENVRTAKIAFPKRAKGEVSIAEIKLRRVPAPEGQPARLNLQKPGRLGWRVEWAGGEGGSVYRSQAAAKCEADKVLTTQRRLAREKQNPAPVPAYVWEAAERKRKREEQRRERAAAKKARERKRREKRKAAEKKRAAKKKTGKKTAKKTAAKKTAAKTTPEALADQVAKLVGGVRSSDAMAKPPRYVVKSPGGAFLASVRIDDSSYAAELPYVRLVIHGQQAAALKTMKDQIGGIRWKGDTGTVKGTKRTPTPGRTLRSVFTGSGLVLRVVESPALDQLALGGSGKVATHRDPDRFNYSKGGPFGVVILGPYLAGDPDEVSVEVVEPGHPWHGKQLAVRRGDLEPITPAAVIPISAAKKTAKKKTAKKATKEKPAFGFPELAKQIAKAIGGVAEIGSGGRGGGTYNNERKRWEWPVLKDGKRAAVVFQIPSPDYDVTPAERKKHYAAPFGGTGISVREETIKRRISEAIDISPGPYTEPATTTKRGADTFKAPKRSRVNGRWKRDADGWTIRIRQSPGVEFPRAPAGWSVYPLQTSDRQFGKGLRRPDPRPVRPGWLAREFIVSRNSPIESGGRDAGKWLLRWEDGDLFSETIGTFASWEAAVRKADSIVGAAKPKKKREPVRGSRAGSSAGQASLIAPGAEGFALTSPRGTTRRTETPQGTQQTLGGVSRKVSSEAMERMRAREIAERAAKRGAGLNGGPAPIVGASMATKPERMPRAQLVEVFDRLKPGQSVRAYVVAVMSSGPPGWIDLKVGRRSTSKKYNYTRIALLRPGQTKANKFADLSLYKRKGRGKPETVTMAWGDMGVDLVALEIVDPGPSKKTAKKTPALSRSTRGSLWVGNTPEGNTRILSEAEAAKVLMFQRDPNHTIDEHAQALKAAGITTGTLYRLPREWASYPAATKKRDATRANFMVWRWTHGRTEREGSHRDSWSITDPEAVKRHNEIMDAADNLVRRAGGATATKTAPRKAPKKKASKKKAAKRQTVTMERIRDRLEYLTNAAGGSAVLLTDAARDAVFRGVNFAKLQKAAEQLRDRRPGFAFDGVSMRSTAPAKTWGGSVARGASPSSLGESLYQFTLAPMVTGGLPMHPRTKDYVVNAGGDLSAEGTRIRRDWRMANPARAEEIKIYVEQKKRESRERRAAKRAKRAASFDWKKQQDSPADRRAGRSPVYVLNLPGVDFEVRSELGGRWFVWRQLAGTSGELLRGDISSATAARAAAEAEARRLGHAPG
jgi:hypothetical protein